MRFVRRRQGFTFIEAIVAIGLLSIIAVITMSIFINMMQESVRVAESRKLTDQARTVMERMRYDLSYAQVDDGSCTGTNGTVYSNTFPGLPIAHPERFIFFKDIDGVCSLYGFEGSGNGNVIKVKDFSKPSSKTEYLTSGSVAVADLRFTIYENAQQQPLVRVNITLDNQNDGSPSLELQFASAKKSDSTVGGSSGGIEEIYSCPYFPSEFYAGRGTNTDGSNLALPNCKKVINGGDLFGTKSQQDGYLRVDFCKPNPDWGNSYFYNYRMPGGNWSCFSNDCAATSNSNGAPAHIWSIDSGGIDLEWKMYSC